MLKSRGAAVVGAFVLIALAIFVRGLLVGDDASGGSDGPKGGDKDDAPVVACTPELMAVCEALAADGTIAKDPPELDLDRADAPDATIDGWITWDPAPQIANFDAGDAAVWEDARPLGSAPAAVLVDSSAMAEVQGACGGSPAWKCLAGLAPDQSIGVGEATTAEGIVRLAPLARSLAVELDPESLDVTALEDVIESPESGQVDAATGATRMATQVGFLSIATGPAALLGHQAETPGGVSRGLRVLTPKPKATLTAVLAPRAGHTDELDALDCEDLPDDVTSALRAAGLTACEGTTDDELAGFLYQVQKKVG